MPDPKPQTSGLDQITQHMRTTGRRLRVSEQPSGTQLVGLVKKVADRLAQIPGEVAAAIDAQSMRRQDIIDRDEAVFAASARAAHQHAAADIASGTVTRPVASPTTVTAAGNGSYGGDLPVGGRVTAQAGMASPGVRNNQVTLGYVAMYVDQDGNYGFAPSTLSTKSLLRSFRPDLDEWLTLIPKVFVYKDDPTKTEQLGFVAELVVKREPMLGIYDEQRRLRGLRYELLGVVCLGLIQALTDETRATRARVDTIAAHLGLPSEGTA